MRPLEDPYLVGEDAASKAKQERLARERGDDDVLVREDQHWDWLLSECPLSNLVHGSKLMCASTNAELGGAREELGKIPS